MQNEKCLIVCFFSKSGSSYAEYYRQALEEAGIEYDVVYFERDGKSLDSYYAHEVVFHGDCPTGGSKLRKLKPMYEYARMVRSLVRTGGYSRLIVLTTVPAVMLVDKLCKDFDGRYVFDVRDYTYENVGAYRACIKRIVAHSNMTVLSSPGFLDFMPDSDKYYFTHNISPDYIEARRQSYFESGSINVGFVGSVRYFDKNVCICDALGNRDGFWLQYSGTHAAGCDIEAYCRERRYKNITFTGSFVNEDKPSLYKDIDIINGVYDTAMRETITALPNRFYDAAIYKCPIMVSKGTYLAQLVDEYGIGFAVDVPNDDLVARIQSYIESFDKDVFEANCERLLQDISIDVSNFETMLRNWLQQPMS